MSPQFNELLTRQVGNEFAASQQYIAIAAWFDGQDLPQLAKHFYRQSLEERNHAMMMVRYILDRGIKITIPGIDPEVEYAIRAAAALLRRSQHAVALSGAGLSAESGIPTFRDSNGLWEGYDVMQVATPEGWAANPELVAARERVAVADARIAWLGDAAEAPSASTMV